MRVLSSKERRKMVMEKRQHPMSTSAEPDFPLAPARSNNISAAAAGQSLARINFPTALQSAGFMSPPFGEGKTVAGKYTASQIDTTNAARMLPHARGSKARSLLPAKRFAPDKTILAREKLAQSKLQARLPKHKCSTTRTAYHRAWHIRKVRNEKKFIMHGAAALKNTLQKLVKAGISFTTNAGAGAFACMTLLALVLMVGMAGALAGSPFGVLFSPQETSADAKSVGAAVAEANNEYFGAVTDIINNTEHDSLVIHRVPNDGATDTRLRNWEEILSVFAVKTTTDSDNATDVVFIDDDRTDRLKEVLWDMVSVSKRVETTGSGEDETKTLHLTITVKTPEQAAQDYNFSQVQTGALTEMLLPENKALLTELIGWATGTGGAGSIGGVGNINGYEVPPEALSDERFAAMLHEAEKYLGMPYVWGGSSPSTSFDCSGFVCWVLNQSGAMSIERTTATGIYNRCTVIPKSEAKPGDLIFFTGTYNSPGPISHIGIYVGDGMMVHAGDPIQFASIESNYWKQHFYAFTRPCLRNKYCTNPEYRIS
ncbi:NlpC/P60 family protein [Clostridiaceae bacterium]|nr:NlpC/P60 family protein [Clostridiaceae bacterium]